jgi:hypothetical protein
VGALIFLAVAAIVIYLAYGSNLRWWLRTRGHDPWPLVPAVIHRAGAEYLSGTESSNGFHRSLFAYDYHVGNERHIGIFVMVTDRRTSESPAT